MEGHAGVLLFGTLQTDRRPVVMMQGRLQCVFILIYASVGYLAIYILSYYEGHSIQDVVFPVRLMKLLEVSHIIGAKMADQSPHVMSLTNPNSDQCSRGTEWTLCRGRSRTPERCKRQHKHPGCI